MDWFNDEQWKGITANLRLSAKAAKIGRCVGIVFDPEPYGDNPWAYAGNEQGPQLRRGRGPGPQTRRPVHDGHPDGTAGGAAADLLPPEPVRRVARRARRLRSGRSGSPRSTWGLLSAFWNGALEAAAPGVRIIDGYEPAYYFTAREPFFSAYHLMKQRSLTLVPPELRTKHAVKFQAGMALYMDQVLALRQPAEKYLSVLISRRRSGCVGSSTTSITR